MTTTSLDLSHAVLAVRWLARGMSLLLVLFWGSFFVAHLREWFGDPANLPPPFVFLIVGLHGLMLLGLLVGWKWEVPGALLTLAASATFFWFASGPNFALFTGLTNIPTLLWLFCGLVGRASPT